ncbi:hypothetical protein [Demequina salsinemoris]|uniref:hypothetical protein n=1 Tax=Demequina salsinemoris TaxID=577470 RepID=UPI0007817951|nr:hypothetical protein [Demequina salsinemoris]
MKLRTTALIAGLLGVVALVVGLVAQTQRPESAVTVPGSVDTAAVVVPADMLAFADGGRYAVDGEGTVLAFSVLPVDLEAWASDKVVTYVEGMPTWDGLTTTVADMAPEPSASPSASAEAADDATSDSGDEASASSSASPGTDEVEYESLLEGSSDLWRDSWTGTDRLSVGAADVETGLDLVFVSEDGSPLTSVDLKMSREVNDGWITPLIVWGGILTAVGLLALLLLIFDVRPVQARAEEWMAHRQRIGAGDEGPKPGSRRARRLQGATIPEAEIESEASESATGAEDAAASADPAEPEPAPDEGPSESDFLPPEESHGATDLAQEEGPQDGGTHDGDTHDEEEDR